jgi:hypothetical protein
VNTVLSPEKSEHTTAMGAENKPLQHRLRILFWCVALVFGFLQAWNNRHSMNSDGISYLDMADAYLSGGWKMLAVGHWSPFYPWLLALAKSLLKPSPYWEFTLVHLVNFLTYVFALAAYEFMLQTFIASRVSRQKLQDAELVLPEWTLRVIGYLIFLWLSLTLITLERVSPDMLMSVFVYLVIAIVLKIRSGWNSWYSFALLGLTLGLGYYAKTLMFPLAFVFLGVALLVSGKLKLAAPRVLLAAVLFLLVSFPLIAGLSHKSGHFTFGDSGGWTYLTEVNKAGPLWYMQDLGTAGGKFQHPPEKIFEFPPVYAFVGPVGGTLPAWYDPTYWAEGARPRIILRRQLNAIFSNAGLCFDLLFTHEAALMVVLLVLCTAGRPLASLAAMLRLWPVWLPAIAALCMYMLVLVQERYVAVFLIVLWTALFSSVRLSKGDESRRLVVGATFALLFALGIPMTLSAAGDFRQGFRRSQHPQWEVAKGLRAMGVQAGDRVGRIGGSHRVEWARLLKVRVIAEIPHEQAEYFWSSSASVQSQVLESFRKTGATAVIAQAMPPLEVFVPAPGWQRIGNSDFYAYLLLTNAKSSAAQTQSGSTPLKPIVESRK